jgi:hypothetical protein
LKVYANFCSALIWKRINSSSCLQELFWFHWDFWKPSEDFLYSGSSFRYHFGDLCLMSVYLFVIKVHLKINSIQSSSARIWQMELKTSILVSGLLVLLLLLTSCCLMKLPLALFSLANCWIKRDLGSYLRDPDAYRRKPAINSITGLDSASWMYLEEDSDWLLEAEFQELSR